MADRNREEEDQELFDAAEDAILRDEAAMMNSGEEVKTGDWNGVRGTATSKAGKADADSAGKPLRYLDDPDAAPADIARGAAGESTSTGQDWQRTGTHDRLASEQPEASRLDDATYDQAPTSIGHLKSEGDVASGGGTVVGTGMRLADDRSWEARYNAMQARKRAERAGLKAQSIARQELLDTGRYFDDGRGNVKLKKEFREYQRVGNGGRRTYNETISDNGSGMRHMAKASRGAYDASMNGWQDALNAQNAEKASASRKKMNDVISLNRESMKMIEAQKAERSRNQARAKFNMVEGYAAAMDALKTELANTDESSFSPIKAWGQGVNGSGKDENGRDARWEYDEKRRVKGQAEAQPTGKYMKRGFVTGPALQALNQRIKEHGGGYQIVGLMATQKFNDVKGTAYGAPIVYARVRTFDEASGRPMFHTEVFTPERAYELGMEAGKAGDIEDYKNLVWQGVGDIHGERAREVAAANLKHTQKLELENAKQKNKLELAEANNKAKMEIADRGIEARRELAAARMAHEKAMKGDKNANSVYERIREIRNLLSGSISLDQRTKLQAELKGLVDQYIQKSASDGNGDAGGVGALDATGGADGLSVGDALAFTVGPKDSASNKAEVKWKDNVQRPTKEEWAKMTTEQKREWLKKNAR